MISQGQTEAADEISAKEDGHVVFYQAEALNRDFSQLLTLAHRKARNVGLY